jgi:hypothetical protein
MTSIHRQATGSDKNPAYLRATRWTVSSTSQLYRRLEEVTERVDIANSLRRLFVGSNASKYWHAIMGKWPTGRHVDYGEWFLR